ncbi:aspartate kinase [Leuconostocaceae bacterium ESL0958]|nr:aspartate kinase [Leuconostocaceae bacterium ESL0958]
MAAFKVCKFGGSSLANAQQFQKVIEIIKADPSRQVIVTSAPGKDDYHQDKVTDLLAEYANLVIADAATGTIKEAIQERYRSIGSAFHLAPAFLAKLDQQIDHLAQRHYPSYSYLRAAFTAQGEYANAQLLAAILQKEGLAARFVKPTALRLRANHSAQDGQLVANSYEELATFASEMNADERYVFPGFFGYDENGQRVTFSRGGSDITGSILAKGLAASSYENFTDVSSLYAIKPGLVAQPAPIQALSYEEMRELSYAGFALFHDEAIIPAIQGQVPIIIKNTNEPAAAGTWIGPEKDCPPGPAIKGIAASKRFCALSLHHYLLNKELGFTLKILKILAKHHVSYEHMPSGIDHLTIIFDRSQLSQAQIDGMQADIQAELAPDQLTWHPHFALLMIVGTGMRHRVGTLSEIISPLKDAKISLQMVNQGASEISIMLGLQVADADRAVRAIYQQFFQ